MSKKKVAIVGFAGTRDMAPFDDPECEIWSVNNLYKFIPRTDRIFQLHNPRLLTDEHHGVGGQEHLDDLKAATVPIYMQQHFDEIPYSVAYPLEEMTQEFGVPRPDGSGVDAYWTNSISFMIALAIHEGFEVIYIYGVDMAVGTEYCVVPETKVLTADLRWVPASDVGVGDQLMGFDEEIPDGMNYRYWRKTKVLAANRLTRPCYRLKMADGTELVSSAEHRWLEDHSQYRWTTTENLRPPIVTPETYTQLKEAYDSKQGTIKELSEKFGVSWQVAQRITSGNYNLGLARAHRLVKLTDVWEPDHSWGAGLLAGAFDSEGHLTQTARKTNNGMSMSLGFSQKDNPLSAAVMDELRQRGFVAQGSEIDGCWKWNLSGAREKARTRRDEILRFLGSIRPPRLLDKFNPDMVGVLHKKDGVRIAEKEFVGDLEVIGLRTTKGTFVANGFASHNSDQRPSCEYYIGIAKGRGIEVVVPVESDLLKTRFVYGYEEEKRLAWDLKLEKTIADMHQRKIQSDQVVKNQQSVSDKYEGAIAAIQEMYKVWQ